MCGCGSETKKQTAKTIEIVSLAYIFARRFCLRTASTIQPTRANGEPVQFPYPKFEQSEISIYIYILCDGQTFKVRKVLATENRAEFLHPAPYAFTEGDM